MGLITGVEGHDRGADMGAGILAEEPGRAIRQPDRDLVAPLDPQAEQPAGELLDLALKLAVGDPPLTKDDRLAPTMASSHLGQHPAGRLVPEWVVGNHDGCWV